MMPLSQAQIVSVETSFQARETPSANHSASPRCQSLLAMGINGWNILFVDRPSIIDPTISSLKNALNGIALSPNEIGVIVLASLDPGESKRDFREVLHRSGIELFPNAIFVFAQEAHIDLALRTECHVVNPGTEMIDLLGDAVLLGQLDGRLQAVIATTRGTILFGCRNENDPILQMHLGVPNPLIAEGIWIFYSQGRCVVSQVEESNYSKLLKINNEEPALRWVKEPWEVDGTALETETICAYAARGVGRFKKVQQDSFLLTHEGSPFPLIAAITDGHGPLGHLFSEAALQFLMKEFICEPMNRATDIQKYLKKVISKVEKSLLNLYIFDPQLKNQYDRSGTTLEVVIETSQGFVIAHVGDSRTYSLSSKTGDLLRLTTDHQDQKGRLLRTLGDAFSKPDPNDASGEKRNPEVTAEPDIVLLDLEKGDSLLLASDGLQILRDNQIRSMIVGRTPGEAVDVMMRAVQSSAPDNVSAIIIEKK